MLKYNVFQLDMFHDGDSWVENSRMPIGTIEVEDTGLEVNRIGILEALQSFQGSDITGRTRPILSSSANLEALFVDDMYGAGEWLEIGFEDDEHMPIWGLEFQE